MRYLSQVFQPVITIPKNAIIKNTEITCKSQKLLVECGLVRPTGAGLFAMLPLARRALHKLESLVRDCLDDVGAQQMSLPALVSAAAWERSGRLPAAAGPGPGASAELLTVRDRHGKNYLLAPTHEEACAELAADVGPLSYKQLPLLLYQISNKYRDELRPKHGLLRAREFSMMDLYALHADRSCAERTYAQLSRAYARLFRALRLPVHRVSAPAGDMGGDTSHEWQAPAAAGEDAVRVCGACGRAALAAPAAPAAPCACGAPASAAAPALPSIEVGHTFLLGTRYSAPLEARVAPAAGAPHPLYMACYGIGITRLLAACVEAFATERALRWPAVIAPYSVCVIGPKEGSREWAAHGPERTSALRAAARAAVGRDVLLDDRHHLTVGRRLLQADRMGYPCVVVCGKASAESPPRYELHRPSPAGPAPPALCTLPELAGRLAARADPACDVDLPSETIF